MYEVFYEEEEMSEQSVQDKMRRISGQAYFQARKSLEVLLRHSYGEKKLVEEY